MADPIHPDPPKRPHVPDPQGRCCQGIPTALPTVGDVVASDLVRNARVPHQRRRALAHPQDNPMGLKKTSGNTATLRPVEERQYPRHTDGLVAQLADADPAVRRWAARDLADHPPAAAAVCERLAVETDTSVRAVLFSTATRLGGPVVVQAMVQLLRSEDPATRNSAIEVLASAPDAVAPHIDHLLADADSDVRIFTVNLLGELKHPQVLRWLTQVLHTEAQVNVVGAALEVLAEVGGVESLPALQAARHRFADDAYIGFSVDLALERIGSA